MSNQPDLLICPKCGSENVQLATEHKLHGKGFSGSKGCCGYIILGPLGILCGACGSGQKLDEKRFWVCNSCGNEFKKVTGLQKMFMTAKARKQYEEFQEAARQRRLTRQAAAPQDNQIPPPNA